MANLSMNNPNWQSDFPEYELEGLWLCVIQDEATTNVNSGQMFDNIMLKRNNISVSKYMPKGFDKYVESVNIPQLNLDMKSNDYGLINFEEKSAYESYTISFYDDIRGSCLGFFTDWMKLIFDEELHCLQPNWRYEAKDVILTYYRTLGEFASTINSNEFNYRNTLFPIVTYRMIKSLPMNISDISAEEDGGDRKTFSVTMLPQRVKNSTSVSDKSNMYMDSQYALVQNNEVNKNSY